MALTRGAKKFGSLILIVAVAVGGYLYAAKNGYVPGKEVANLIIPKKMELTNAAPLSSVSNVPMHALPSNSVLGDGEEYRFEGMAWNTQLGAFYSNGGAITTKGSIASENGINNLRLIRVDDCNQIVNDLIAFGTEFKKSGGNPKKGVQFVSLMLDGTPSYFSALKAGLEPLGLHAVLIFSTGRSAGEDGFWGAESWIKDPSKMKGAVVVGVLFDGDMNDAIKFASDNGVRVNPDVKTYDPDALNIMAADDYLKAVDMWKSGAKEEREVVRNGVKTGSKKTVVADAVVTWTPGDVRIAKEKGGLVPIITTEDYYWQMPQATITIKEWANANRPAVLNILKSFAQGGSQVKVHDKALYKAAEISAKVYAIKGATSEEKDPKYWYENFKRHEITDKTGKKVKVGGSMNFGIEDNIVCFGTNSKDGGPAKSSYTLFGDKMAELWPEKMKAYPAFDEVFDASYIEELSKTMTLNKDLEQKPTYDAAPIRETVSSQAQDIQFHVGNDQLTPAGKAQVKKLYDNINTTSLKVLITGHADAQGTAQQNLVLSERRAKAVQAYLVARGFPDNRINVDFKGDTQPVDPARTPAAFAKNRRVVIELGK